MNNLKPEHQTQAVSFPDVSPSDLPGNAQFSMTAGDFLEVTSDFREPRLRRHVPFDDIEIEKSPSRFIQRTIIGTA